jgi:membrane-associated protein
MVRLVSAAKGMVVVGLAVHIHHRFHGASIDYLGLAAAAGASWVGLPGPGEPVLIAEAVFAARHDLDITSVIVVAWLSATAGGIVGWVIGLKAGRALLTGPGPLRRLRVRAVQQGERVFARQPVLAILLAPAFVAGIHRVRTSVYLLVNAVGAALWAAGIGLAAYWAGPPVVDAVGDLGTVTLIGLGVLVVVVLGSEFVRRRRGHGKSAHPDF